MGKYRGTKKRRLNNLSETALKFPSPTSWGRRWNRGVTASSVCLAHVRKAAFPMELTTTMDDFLPYAHRQSLSEPQSMPEHTSLFIRSVHSHSYDHSPPVSWHRQLLESRHHQPARPSTMLSCAALWGKA